MVTRERIATGNCDGFGVYTPAGLVGWVEEMWLDGSDEPRAFALRLVDGRRGLLLADGVEEIVREQRSISVSSGVRMLELEPPHLDVGADGDAWLTASWRTTGAALEPPEPPGQIQQVRLGLHRPVVPAAQAVKPPRPIWEILVLMYPALAVVALLLIGIDFLVAYVTTGSPPL
jgi:hypothetical protein